MFSKTFKFLALTLCIISTLTLTSCYVAGGDNADYPRHLENSAADVKKALPKGIIMPNISKTEFRGADAKYYTVNIPGHITTGFSIDIDPKNSSTFAAVELRGIKTSIKGVDPERFNDKDYTAIISETPIKIGDRDCKYAAFTDKTYSADDIAEQKGLANDEVPTMKVPKDNLNIKYFYIYSEDKDIRYSITFSDFSVGTINEEICDACLKNSKGFFENLK